MNKMVPPGNDCKSNYRKLQIRCNHKQSAGSLAFIIDRSVEFRKIQIYWKIQKARREQCEARSHARSEKNGF